jgi:hypothetical protein
MGWTTPLKCSVYAGKNGSAAISIVVIDGVVQGVLTQML